MNRCRFGLALLILLLLAGFWVTRHMEKVHEPMIADISQAAQQVLAGNWAAGEALLHKTQDAWSAQWGFSASLSDHEPMENINILFSRLAVAAQGRDAAKFADLCAELTAELEAMGDAHGFVWWNFL